MLHRYIAHADAHQQAWVGRDLPAACDDAKTLMAAGLLALAARRRR